MANNLTKSGITSNGTIEAWHVTQSIDAFTGQEAYDINLSGSLDLVGLLTNGSPNNVSSGLYSHAEGSTTISLGINSHAEGVESISLGNSSHAEGHGTITSGSYSHSEGYYTIARGNSSHAEGVGSLSESGATYNIALGGGSHVEGNLTTAVGDYSHAEGSGSTSVGVASHAEGINTIASGSGQSVVGRYNTHNDSTSRFIVGNGTSESNRADAFKITRSGSMSLPQTQSSAPTWTGTDGEIVTATVSGVHLLYIWMSNGWRSGSFI